MGWSDPLPSLFRTSSGKVKYINFLSRRSAMGAIGLPRKWISRDFWNVTAWLVLVTTKSSLCKGCSEGKSRQDKWNVTKCKQKWFFFSLVRTRRFWFLMLLLGAQWGKGRDLKEAGRIVPCYGFLLHKSKICTASQEFLFPGYRSSGSRGAGDGKETPPSS